MYTYSSVLTTTSSARIEVADYRAIALNYAVSKRALVPGCGGSFNTIDGVITSPDYNRNDRNFSECLWNITVPAPNKIRLNFQCKFR